MNIAETLNGIERAAADIIKAEQGDYYGEDGLLVCGKCHTPKQVRVHILGKERTPYCLCQCMAEAKEREEAERQRLAFEKRVGELRRACFSDGKMEKWTFANDDRSNERVSAIASRFAENFDTMREGGKGLLFFGTVGTGKTYAAAAIANALIDRGIPVMLAKFADIRNTVQGMFEGRQEYFDRLNRYPLLILDDLSAESGSEYMQEIVYNVIDGRYKAGLPLIVTTNLTAEQLKNPAEVTNQRTFSRLLEMCLPVEVKGDDRRREKCRDDFGEYKKLLGL